MKKVDAVDFYRSQTELADALKIKQAAVSQWGDLVPEKQALKLDRITDGKLKYDPALYTKAD